MKKNKYIVKFTYPMPGGTRKILYTPVDMTCSDDDSAAEFLDFIREACMVAVQDDSGRAVHYSLFDIKMISLVDSVNASLI